MSTPRHTESFDAEAMRRKERAERAARLAAMFERWEAEDVSGEPDWDPDQLPRVDFGGTTNSDEPAR